MYMDCFKNKIHVPNNVVMVYNDDTSVSCMNYAFLPEQKLNISLCTLYAQCNCVLIKFSCHYYEQI